MAGAFGTDLWGAFAGLGTSPVVVRMGTGRRGTLE
jgi:hypothetical protein